MSSRSSLSPRRFPAQAGRGIRRQHLLLGGLVGMGVDAAHRRGGRTTKPKSGLSLPGNRADRQSPRTARPRPPKNGLRHRAEPNADGFQAREGTERDHREQRHRRDKSHSESRELNALSPVFVT